MIPQILQRIFIYQGLSLYGVSPELIDKSPLGRVTAQVPYILSFNLLDVSEKNQPNINVIFSSRHNHWQFPLR